MFHQILLFLYELTCCSIFFMSLAEYSEICIKYDPDKRDIYKTQSSESSFQRHPVPSRKVHISTSTSIPKIPLAEIKAFYVKTRNIA